MRSMMLVVALGTTMWGQSLLEHGAAAAGGSVGGVAGKKVGEGVGNIFKTVDRTAAKAAKADRSANPNTPLMEVGPGVPKGKDSVPAAPKPLVRHIAAPKLAHAHMPAPAPVSLEPVPLPPPPPEMTKDDLLKIAGGMDRQDVLKLGAPAVRITMFEDGHLVEIYRYMAKDATISVVRLSDGTVSSIQMP